RRSTRVPGRMTLSLSPPAGYDRESLYGNAEGGGVGQGSRSAPLVLLYISFRYSCTNWTAIAPSPTAEATRLTEPERTSPAANTPGWLVSSRNGGRRKFQRGESPMSIPVRTKSFSSFSISRGNQSVRG